MNHQTEMSSQKIVDGPLGKNPPPTSPMTSKTMRSNKPKNTRPEITIRQALFNGGIKGYRIHWDKVPGKPDIAFPGRKIAIFVYGCYWHRCSKCNLKLPKTNTEFWRKKFILNKTRDVKKRQELENLGWKVIELWECDIKTDVQRCLTTVEHAWTVSSRD